MNGSPVSDPVEVEIAHEALIRRWPRLRGWLARGDDAPRAASLRKRFHPDPERANGRLLPRRIRRLVASTAPGPGGDGLDPLANAEPASREQVEVEVAHEALIRHWPTLRAWLDEDRADLLLRESVREAAQEWDGHGRDESYLAHRGRRLDQAGALRHHPRLRLNPLEDAYLQASLALREREEQEREAQRRRELDAQRERAELAEAAQHEAERRVAEQKKATRRLRLVAALVGVAAIAALFFAWRANQQELAANRQAQIARAQALAAEAPRQHELGEDERGALLARQAFLFNEEVDGPTGASAGAALRAALGVSYYSVKLPDHGLETAFVDFGAESRTLVTGSRDGAIRVWDLRDPARPPTTLGIPTSARTPFAFSSDGTMTAIGTGDASVHLWRLDQPEAEPVAFGGEDDAASPVRSIAFSADGQSIAAGSDDGTIRLWATSDSPGEATIVAKAGDPVAGLAFSGDGAALAGSAADGAIRLWNLNDLTADPEVLGGQEQEESAPVFAFSPTANTLASGGADGVTRLWDLTMSPPTATVLPGPKTTGMQSILPTSRRVASVAFAPDGLTLAAGLGDASLRLWDLGRPPAEPVVLRDPAERTLLDSSRGSPSVAFSPDGQILAVGGYGTTRLWYIQHPVSPRSLTGLEPSVYGVAFSADGQTIASVSIEFAASGRHEESWVRLWRPFAANLADATSTPPGQNGGALTVAFSPDGQLLASGSSDGVIRLWDLREPTRMPRFLRGSEAISTVAFSPDGQTLASGGLLGSIVLWPLADPDPRATQVAAPTDRGRQISSLDFGPDGQSLAAGDWDGIVRLFDLGVSPATATVILEQPRFRIGEVAFSPDGSILAASSWDGLIRLWDLTALPASPTIWRGEDGAALSLAFSPDGVALAYGSDGGTVRIRGVRNPVTAQVVLTPGKGPVRSLAFSPDGQFLAEGSEDGVVRLWLAGSQGLNELVCQLVWRNLTLEEWRQFVGADAPYERTCPELPPGEGAESAEALGIVAADARA